MRAAIAQDNTVAWVERPRPEPGPGEVCIAVHATAVNRADLVQVAGRYNPPAGATDVLGLECAGVVVAVGPGVDVPVGSRVAALLVGGGYAEYVTCPAAHLLPVPDDMPMTTAAALPEVWITAWLNLIHEGGLAPGERVLLHAGASGVGTAGIQLCRMLDAAVWVVVGSQEKLDRCRALGAAGGVNRHESQWSDHVADWTDGKGLDLILDPVGADTVPDALKALAPRGRLVLIGLLSGREAAINLGLLLVKRLRLQGSVLRGRSVAEKTALLEPFRRDIWPKLLDGTLQPVIEAVLPASEAANAHATLAKNNTVGKLVLNIV